MTELADGRIEGVKIIAGGLAAFLVNALGGYHRYIIVLIMLMFSDTASGWLKAKKLGMWKSRQARWGFAGKVVELTLILMLHVLDWAFGTTFLMSTGIFYYCIVEGASVLENINDGQLAVLPSGLVDMLRKLKFSVGTFVVNKLKKVIIAALGSDFDEPDNDKPDNNKEDKNL